MRTNSLFHGICDGGRINEKVLRDARFKQTVVTTTINEDPRETERHEESIRYAR